LNTKLIKGTAGQPGTEPVKRGKQDSRTEVMKGQRKEPGNRRKKRYNREQLRTTKNY
jgi:hypothetical protein